MKQQYVPLDKRSKREKKEYYAEQRNSWGEVNPVTRKTENKKAYNRKKAGRWKDYDPSTGFLLYFLDSALGT